MVELTHLVGELYYQSTYLAASYKPPHFTVQASYRGRAEGGGEAGVKSNTLPTQVAKKRGSIAKYELTEV